MSTHHFHCDILILGAGLSGLRAAISALETSPSLKIAIVSPRQGPTGSSFANQNKALGMQVCRTDQEQDDFVREAVTLARPGTIDPSLVTILAEESLKRLQRPNNVHFTEDGSRELAKKVVERINEMINESK